MAWAGASGWHGARAAAKADKLNQRDRAAALKEAEAKLGEGMTAQVFSATDKIGVAGGPEAPASCMMLGELSAPDVADAIKRKPRW